MYCCPNCFNDIFLKRHLLRESNQKSKCSLCDAEDIEVIDPNDLLDIFQPLIDFYIKDETGLPLSQCIQQDWQTFNIEDSSLIKKLLIALLDDEDVGNNKYKSKITYDKSKLEKWQDFREELMHKNRYFPELIPDDEDLRNLFELLTLPIDRHPDELYRARINSAKTPHSIEDMGMPPNNIVSNGRANPIGISYLYTASDIETALSEARPSKGDVVTVLKLEVVEPLALVDLRNPRISISPFALDEDGLIRTFTNMPFLILLGDELSKPVVPRAAALEYLPSQYLCEFVKHIGFEGIVYRSSICVGDNYAIFNEDKLKRVQTSQYRVDNTKISFSRLH